MRVRPTKEHSEILARRLEQLTADLQLAEPAVRPAGLQTTEEHTRIRPAVGHTPYDAPPQPREPEVAEELAPALPRVGRHAADRRTGWLDVGALSGRVRLEPAHVAIAAVVAAIALAVTCWWVLRDDAGEPLAAPVPTAPLVTPSGPEPSTEPTGTGTGDVSEIVVDVTGKVRRPGVVVLAPGARVVDAVDAAGGATRGADLTGLNLARVLADGEQVVVGIPPAPGLAASSAADPSDGSADGAGVLVNLNLAGLDELDSLPGVGPVTAQAILDWREANGGFSSVDQLLDVKGIGEATLAELAPLVTI